MAKLQMTKTSTHMSLDFIFTRKKKYKFRKKDAIVYNTSFIYFLNKNASLEGPLFEAAA